MAKVKCIYGAPCSGKSTFVENNLMPGDIVWDFDSIRQSIALCEKHDPCTDAINDMVNSLRYTFAKNAKNSDCETVYFITTKPSDSIKELLGDDCEYIEMEATKDECLERLYLDEARPDKEFMKELINRYFDENEEQKEEGRSAMKDMETRTFLGSVECRASEDDSKMTIFGKPIVFNERTDISGMWEEVIDPSAIDEETLRDVRLLVNHDFNGIPLARSRRNTKNSTMRLAITEDAVEMEADLDESNPKAIELNSAIKRGDISGMSFAFLVDGDSWDDLDSDYPKRTITHISEIFEVSAVTWPAYEQTSISARSLESGQKSLADARAALESARVKAQKIADLNQRLKEINHD